MSKKLFIGISIVVVVIIGAGAAFVLRTTPEASAPIETMPVEIQEVPEMAETTGESEMDEAGQAGGAVTFTINPAGSEARFILDELLRGAPKTVVGSTNQVSGEIIVDFKQPEAVQLSTILVNARTLVTDNDFRNRAINNQILDTRTYEFITFTPTGISGFPENPDFGQALAFQISGDLTIRDVTHPVTFEAEVTAESEDLITGSAAATVARDDFGLVIPSVPGVADVDEEVRIEIELRAERQ